MTAHKVTAAPTTAVVMGSNPINGITKKKGTLKRGLNHACLKEKGKGTQLPVYGRR